MSYNGSGTFLINSAGQPVVPGTTITTTAFNALTADLASGLTTAMTKDGQTVPTANIPMGGFKLTGLGAGTSATDAAQFGQLQNAPVATLITVSGADTITGTLVQTLTAYATGQQFSFVAAGTNTTAVTLNIDGLGAKAVTRTGAVALAAGALVSGQMAIVEYDGTRFQLINANAFTNLTVSGALTVGTTLAVTGVATLTAQPILSSLTASLPVFTDASKGLVSNTMTGTGSVMMSASPTTTGTLTAAAINASGLVAMAAAATVGTTLGVTGNVGVGGAANASQNITILPASGSTSGVDQYGIFLNRTGVTGTNTSTALLSYIETSGTVASAYGLHTGVYKNGGTITTAYGLYVDDMIYGTTNYSIYTGAGLVRLGGNTAVAGTLGVGGAAVGFGNGYNEITIATGANGAMLYLQGTGPLNHRLYGNGAGVTYDASGATSHQFVNNGVNTLGISSAGAVTITGTLGVTSTVEAGLTISRSTDATCAIYLSRSGGANSWGVYRYGSSGSDRFAIGRIGASEDFIISTAGIVTMSAYGVGTATFSATGVISSVSDERLKIKDGVIADPIPMIMALEPGYYFGKPEANMGDGRQLGFYAQNVRKAIGPEAAPDPEDQVNLDADGNEVSRTTRPWGYYDRSVLAVAIEALKVHEGRLAALQADFQAYKSSHP